MSVEIQTQWIAWARRIQAIAQSGRAYTTNPYDLERYDQLQHLASEILATITTTPLAEVLATFEMQTGYATPKVDVRGAIVRDGQILLVQERADQRWCLPGGWADVGNTPVEMVAREVLEESGLSVTPTKLVGIFDANRTQSPLTFFHAYKLIFLCTATSGELQPSTETLQAAFFSFDALPELSEQRTSKSHLQEIQAHLLNPQRPAAFD